MAVGDNHVMRRRMCSVWVAMLVACDSAEKSADATLGDGATDASSALPDAHDAPDSASDLDAGVARDAAGTALTDGGSSARFSFFVTSLSAMRRLSDASVGFGGDLRFGETGAGAGLRGADKICATIAEQSLPGAGAKTWRAFLSAATAADGGGPVHAIDRIGEGPWYDRKERLVASSKAALLSERPADADPVIADDLPNELGVPNHNPDGRGDVDNHDTLTGSDATGHLYTVTPGATCQDWTSAVGSAGTPRVGHSWIRNVLGTGSSGLSGRSWISSLDVLGCAPGTVQDELGVLAPDANSVGSASGYGGIYCFALTP